MFFDPATTIIFKLGGPSVVSRITGSEYSVVCRWRKAKGPNGSGGVIPTTHARALLAYAKKKEIDVTAEDFLEEPCEVEFRPVRQHADELSQ